MNAPLRKLLLLVVVSYYGLLSTSAQCTGCQVTITAPTSATFNLTAGQTVCITGSGAFTGLLNNFNGNTLCIGSGVTYNPSSAPNYNGNWTIINNGTFQNTSNLNFNSGTSFTNNATGIISLGGINLSSGMSFTNYGTLSLSSVNINSGASVVFGGTTTISGSLSNNGALTVLGSITAGSITNNGSGTVIGGVGTNCNYIRSTGSFTNTGSFGGSGQALLVGNSGGTISSPATSTVPASPVGQPSSLVLTQSGTTINGSFSSVTSGGYVVLRAIATSAPAITNPSNFSNLTVGQTLGSWTVAAINVGSTTTTFSDVVGATCTQINYCVFSYASSGNCKIYNTTSPLTGSYNPVPTIAGTTPASICPSATATLGATASAGSINWYAAASGGSSLGTGTSFVTPSLNASTTYYVDATNNGCTTATRTAVVATVLGSPSITLSSVPTVCSGTSSVLVTYSNSLNSPDQYMVDWDTTANTAGIADTSWATLSGGSITLSGLIATAGNYVANVYVRNSVTGCQSNVSSTPVVTCGTVTENGVLTLTAPAGGVFTTINFASYGTPTGSCGAFATSSCNSLTALSVVQTAALGRNSFSLSASNGVFGDPCVGTLKRLYVEAVSNGTVLTINANPVITVQPASAAATYCLNGTAIALSVTATGTGLTYQWYSNTTASNSGGTLLVGATATTYTPLTTSAGILYYYVVVTGSSCSTISAVSGAITTNSTIPTVSSTTPGSRVGTGTVVLGATASAGTLNWYAAATGGSSLGTGTSFTTPSITLTTSFYVDVTSGGCVSGRTAVVATVYNAPTITISSVPTICAGTTSVIVPYTNPTDSPDQYMVDWSAAANAAGLADVPWTTLSGGSITLSGLIATAGSYYAAIYVRNTTTGAQGTAIGTGGTTVSCGTVAENATLTMTTPSGGIFTAINFASYGTPTGSCGSFAVSSCHSATSMSVIQTAALGRTTFSIAASNGVFGDPCVGTVKRLYVEAVSVGFSLTINALPSITVSPSATSQNYCQNSTPSALAITASGTGLTYQWYSNTASSNSGGSLVVGATAASYSPLTTSVGTNYYYAIVTNAATCTLTSSVSGAIAISAPTVAGTLSAASTTICANTKPNAITLSGYTGSIVKWQYAADAAFTIGVTDIVSTASTLTSAVLGTLASTRYYRAAVQSGSCSLLYTTPLAITVPLAITYNGSWNGTPSSTTPVIIASNYTLSANLNVCSCQISSTANVVVPANKTLVVQEGIIISGTGSLTIADQGSLVQIDDAAVNSGVITYQRNTVPVKRYDYTYWSSPVSNQNLLTFSPNTLVDKYYQFSPTIGNWQGVAPSTTAMQVGRGYIIRAPQTNSITSPTVFGGSFVGTPNNGVITYTVENAASNWNLIGNPYPSALDIDAFFNDASNAALVNGTVYLWTHNTLPSNQIPGNWTYNYTSDDYALYNSTGAVSTGSALSTGINTTTPNGKIAAGQAFFLKAKATGSIRFSNSMRVIDNNTGFFRTVAPIVQNPGKHRIWLNLTNSEGLFKQILVGYIPGATNGYDSRFDGETMNGNSYADFYSMEADAKTLSIQARALPFDEQDLVTIGFKATLAGNFTISLDHFDGLFQQHAVFLEDKLLHVVHDLKAGPYDFATVVGTFTDRFQLRYTNESLGTSSFDVSADSVIVYKQNQQLVVNTGATMMSQVEIYDIRGRLLLEQGSINATEVRLNVGAANEVLLVKVTMDNNRVVTKKVVN